MKGGIYVQENFHGLDPKCEIRSKFSYCFLSSEISPDVFEKVWNATVTSVHGSKQCKQ